MNVRGRLVRRSEGDRATPFELFFDLVFVYAITQVTALMADEQTVHSVVRGMLVLGVLWWCWSGFAWMGNTIRLDEGVARGGLFLVMAAMFVIAQTVPEAFLDASGGLPGPLVFVAAYFVVRLEHQLLYMHATRGDANMRRQLALNWIPWVGSVALLTVAAFQDGWLQTGLWAAALAWDYVLVLVNGVKGWRVTSAAHWAERHGLILIVAIGESIVAIGIGAAGVPMSWPILAAAVLGIAVASALWWAYFDVVALAAEHELTAVHGMVRARMATHAYTYLHLPLTAGIVLVALGIEEVMATSDHPAEPLHGIGPFALYGGAIIYLAGYLGFGRVMFKRWKASRIVTAAVLAAALPLAAVVPALAALGLLALVLAAMVGYESIRYADRRQSLRSQ